MERLLDRALQLSRIALGAELRDKHRGRAAKVRLGGDDVILLEPLDLRQRRLPAPFQLAGHQPVVGIDGVVLPPGEARITYQNSSRAVSPPESTLSQVSSSSRRAEAAAASPPISASC